MKKRESALWKKLKKETEHLIKWTRIENIASSGTPDLLGCSVNTGYFTLELKVSTSNGKVLLSPYQIAFNKTRYSLSKQADILVLDCSNKHNPHEQWLLKLYGGDQAPRLAKHGLDDCSPIYAGTSFLALVSSIL